MNDLNLSREEIKEISEKLADIILNVDIGPGLIEEENITPTIDVFNLIDVSELPEDFLEKTVTSVGGITDPFGQLRSFVKSMIDWAVATLSGSIQAFISDFFSMWDSVVNTVLSLPNLISQIVEQVSSLISGFTQTIESTITSISQIIEQGLQSISSTVQSLQEAFNQLVLTPLQQMIEEVTSFLNQFPSMIQSVITSIQNQLTSIVQGLAEQVGKIIEQISEYLKPVQDAIQNIVKQVSEIPAQLQKIFEDISKSLQNIISSIVNEISKIPQQLSEIFAKIPEAVQDVVKNIANVLESVFNEIIKVGKEAYEYVSEQTKAIYDYISKIGDVKTVGEALLKFGDILHQFQALLQGFINPLVNIQSIFERVRQAIEGFWKWLVESFSKSWDALVNFFTKDFPKILSDIHGLVSELFKDPLGWISKNVIEPLKGAFDYLSKQLWTLIPDWLKNVFESLGKFYAEFVKVVSDFAKDPLGWINKHIIQPLTSGFSFLAEKIWELLPDWLKNAIEIIRQSWDNFWKWINEQLQNLPKIIDKIWEGIEEFTKDPLGFFKEKIVSPLVGALAGLSCEFVNLMQEIGKYAVGAISYLNSLGQEVFKTVSGAVQALINSVYATAKGVGDFFYKTIASPFISATKSAFEGIKEELMNVFKAIIESRGARGEIEFLAGSFAVLSFAFIPLLALPYALKALSSLLRSLELRLNLRPMGVGMTGIIVSELGRICYELGKLLEKAPATMLDAVFISLAVSSLIPLQYFNRWLWKNTFKSWLNLDFAWELPTIENIVTLTRRKMPTEDYSKMLDNLRLTFEMRGYQDWFIEEFISEKPAVSIKTRANIVFPELAGNVTEFKTGLIFSMPTPSELCRMMIRDIFLNPEDFAKVMKMHGFDASVATMYYLLHFKYPSPEKIWEIYTRSWAHVLLSQHGQTVKAMLWYIKDITENDVNAFREVVLPTYMKWHDYFNVSWFKGIVEAGKWADISDRDIVIELMADIPGKIDVRWMWKWGIVTPVELGAVHLARGLNPAWLDKVVIAECMNAMTEERTFMRTGLINMYKEGYMELKSLDTFMQGFFTLSFKVPYYDGTKITVKDVSYPVMFLEGERKLLEIRAVFDRALDILRDFIAEIKKGARELIISKEEFTKLLLAQVEAINRAFFRDEIKQITGKDVQLSIDLKYFEPYLRLYDVFEVIYTVRRIRTWSWSLIWLVGRLTGYGIMDESSAKAVLESYATLAKLSKAEKEFMSKFIELVAKSYERYRLREQQREYIPTPMMLATIAELVPEARQFFIEVMKKRKVPEEWFKIWEKYLVNRVYRDEVRGILSEVCRHFERFIISEEDFKKHLAEFLKWGYDEKEIEMIFKRYELRRMTYAYNTLLRNPYSLATMAEYSPSARDFALKKVQDMIDILPLRPEEKALLKKMWEEFIRNRAISNEVSRFITELISDFAEGAINETELRNFLNKLKKYGLDDYEINMIVEIAKLRRERYILREMRERQM